jgi:hypothetical protein
MRGDAYSREQIAAIAAGMIRAGMATALSFQRMMPDFDKPAGKPCPHQSHDDGCPGCGRRPLGCRYWDYWWPVNDDTAERRPDGARYVLDPMPDYLTMQEQGRDAINIEVVQIWFDPKDRDAWWRDETLLAYVGRCGGESKATLIRFSAHGGMTAFPVSMSSDGL